MAFDGGAVIQGEYVTFRQASAGLKLGCEDWMQGDAAGVAGFGVFEGEEVLVEVYVGPLKSEELASP